MKIQLMYLHPYMYIYFYVCAHFVNQFIVCVTTWWRTCPSKCQYVKKVGVENKSKWNIYIYIYIYKGCSRSSEASLKCIVHTYTQSRPFKTLEYYCVCLELIATKSQTYILYYGWEPVTTLSCSILSIFQ